MATVHVPPSGATEVAQRLLAAAEALGLPASVVRTSSDGVFGFSFEVPDEVDEYLHGTSEESDPEDTPAPKKRGRPRKAAAPDAEPEE